MRSNPCTYLPRRLQIVASLTVFVILAMFFLGSATEYGWEPPYSEELSAASRQITQNLPQLPKFPPAYNPFRAPAHAPPEQANSTSGEAKWFSDWKWQNPFSSTITLDEDRAVLPPLPIRPPIYTYYDPAGRRKDEKSKRAESDLLQIWRRAWWAQGFKPVVLGSSEATNNPLYRQLQGLNLGRENPDMEFELMRWLAWGNMGTGILANWLTLPMAPHDDALLSQLRRGEYPELTRYEGLENGLFIGQKDAIEGAIKSAFASPAIKSIKSIVEAVPSETFVVDPKHDGVAFYSMKTIKTRYNFIREKLEDPATISDGLAWLPQLINSHLQITWQNTFSSGIAVLKPWPEVSTHLVSPAIEVARNLSQCPDSPIPASCPPNRPNCKPCVASHPILISTPAVFRNTSTTFTIGTIPHPYTMTTLLKKTDSMDVKLIRRNTDRDPWITKATKELLGTGMSSFSRLVDLKDAIASEYGSAHSLWLTAERPPSKDSEKDLEELDWTFGFRIPRAPMATGKSETPVPGPERRPAPPKPDGPVTSEADLQIEKSLFMKAQMALQNRVPAMVRMRDIVEAWNLADTEAWKFARAFNARRRIERRKWEEEEEDFLGKGAWSRWFDG